MRHTSLNFRAAIRVLFLAAFLLTSCATFAQTGKSVRLQRDDWAPDVKAALNDFLDLYGKDSADYDKNSYVVFDFDNTTAIFDVEEQLVVYQMETMAYAIEPKDMFNVLTTGLKELDADRSSCGYKRMTYRRLFGDIAAAYEKLWSKYGPFTPKGLDESKLDELHADPYWQEFAAKLRFSYDLVDSNEPTAICYPWIIYWVSGMTEEEVYQLTKRSCEKYRDVDSKLVKWTSPAEIESEAGQIEIEFTDGVSVTENLKELWTALKANGVDVWVCSASATDAIRAAVDVNGLHDSCKGVVAMTMVVDKDGKYAPAYDYETGCGYYCNADGTWTKMTRPEKTQTAGVGKSIAVMNAIAPEYAGNGPLAGFMDSTGDFNFCSEFKSLKVVACFNRGNRKLTDGGGLIAAIALYERNVLGYDLRKANAADDVLYVLQGRDENGKRTFRNANATLRLGSNEEVTLAGKDNYAFYDYLAKNKPTVKNALETFAIKRAADKNEFGAKSGFLDEYLGYRAR